MSKTYSPTRMREWLRCPYRASLLEQGWHEQRDWENAPVTWIGIAVHAGLAYYFNPDTEPPARRYEMNYAKITAEKVLENEYKDPPRLTSWDFDRALKLTFKCIDAVLVSRYDQIRAEDVAGVETEMGGVGRKDMVYRVGDAFRVVDWKVRRKAPREMRAWDHDWQLWQYAWEVSQVKVVDQVEVCVVTLEPRVQVMIHEVPVTVARLEEWEHAAAWAWAWREATENRSVVPPKLWTGCDVPFYACDYKPHCHEGASLEAFYTKEPKEERDSAI